ncbi:hypothetical protein N0B44_20490 [Roseibacterium beibuensis]|uniref:hypothetical protein n=1 Tax=[Roseibacterium] beibuensis TaxID=1193142 RepID=UPI00217E56E0|nr:hypothetical protein [Roseibacterium beibuensis]MCS6625294.1 hypothetical protein [Roseibacterium beibuensis]
MTTTNNDSGLEPVIRTGDEPPQAFVQIRKPPKRTTWPWLVAGMIFIVLVSFIAGLNAEWAGDDGLAGALGYGLGYSLIPALLLGFAVYLVIYFAALKRSNRDNGGRYLAVLVVTALLSGMTMSVLAGRLQAAPFDGEVVRAALESTYAEQAAARTHVEQELAKADPEVFSPVGLKRRGGYDRAAAELERRRELMAGAISANEEIGARLRQSVEGAISNPGRRRRLMAEFDAGYEGRRAAVMAFWETQTRMLDLTEAQIDLLRASRWESQGENFMFYRQADLDAFAARKAEIDRLTAESTLEHDRLKESLEDSRRKVAEDLDKLG